MATIVAGKKQRTVNGVAAAPSARWRALRRVLRTPITLVGLVLVILLIGMAVSADFLPLRDPNAMSRLNVRKPPGTPGYPLGTDAFGRDILSRIFHGARISLVVSLSVVAVSTLAGMVLGLLVGYLGGALDAVVGRIWDVLFSFPGIILFLVIMGTLGSGLPVVILAITIGAIPGNGRLMRERVLAMRNRDFVEAARVLGASSWRIMFKHVLPNSLTPILVSSALAIPGVIQAEAGLSYLGLGVPPPHASWGKMIAEGQDLLELAPWISLIPGAFILLATLGFNLVGDGLRDYLDPTQLR